MRYLLDTNIVLRLANEDLAEHGLVTRAVRHILAQGGEPVIVPQCVHEFWSVGTRPAAVNGFGWDDERMDSEAGKLLGRFALLHDTPEVFVRWLALATLHGVRGKQVHDARLAAAALAHGVEQLLTLNVPDFRRFGVPCLHPSGVIA